MYIASDLTCRFNYKSVQKKASRIILYLNNKVLFKGSRLLTYFHAVLSCPGKMAAIACLFAKGNLICDCKATVIAYAGKEVP